MKRILPGLWPLLMMLVTLPPAQAAWMGLDDGDHLINLNCTQSSQIACPSTTTGSVSVVGNDIVAFDFTIDGVAFVGNPVEGHVDGNLVDFDFALIQTASPFTFLSLRLITDGQIGSFGVGDLWWVYCNETADPNACTPNTTGLWTAQPVPGVVPEPQTPGLLAAALLALGGAAWRRRSHA